MNATHAMHWRGGRPGGPAADPRARMMDPRVRMLMAFRGARHGGPFGRGRDPRGGFPFGGFPFGGFGRGPKVRRGDVRAAALALIAEQPRNGYQIIQEIGARSGGLWQPSPGSVYPALQQLEDEGLIRAEQQDGQRLFHLTEQGQAHVEAHKAELANPWNTVADSVSDGVVEIWRLFAQVAQAARQVSQHGSTAQVAQARQVLADTRRALYRILAEDEPVDL